MEAASVAPDNGGADATGLVEPASDQLLPPGSARAVCLDREGDDVLIMLHEPEAGAAGDTAVLLCPPFGWQQDCSYRGLRAWARELARAGYPAARVTLPSTGDSAGSPREGGRLDAWTAAVGDGARWLRRTTSAKRVVAIGIGLGGMVCYRAAAAGAAIDELVLWAVPGRGRALLRELRGHHQIIAAAFPDDIREDPDAGGDLELIGYTMTEETAGALGDLRLTSLALARVPRRVLMLGRDGIAPDAKLAEHLTTCGSDVESADGHDYAELMANPQQSLAPRRTMELTLEWLARDRSVAGVPEPQAAVADGSPRGAAEADTLGCAHDGIAVREIPIWFDGVRGRIFGILAEPDTGERAPLCAVFLGAGAVPHTGPNRSWVDLSRTWAARGVPSLRIDCAGVGESEGEDPELVEDESLYDPWRDREVELILDQLQQQGVADRFVLGGLCSGAYRSVRRALVDPRVRGLLLLNLYAFEWSHELVIERGRRVAISKGVPGARGHALNRDFLAKSMGYARPDRAWRLLRRTAEREQKRVVVDVLDQLCDRRVQTLLLLGADEPLLAQLERQGLTDRLPDWPNLILDRPSSGDHMYRARWLQRHVYAALDGGVDRAVAGVNARPVIGAGTS